ncbi:hypothetical protein EZV62_008133 [Acer yangbiense]|uniref:Amino acid transporter transmembrane domain-containing protein n=1 Tax=Acer yangbiense TaxID=1000413 RepID=A0A5C7ICP5_9ROSI|nr:hypothetical protein EZV62_008133 [Acer yangbiense]
MFGENALAQITLNLPVEKLSAKIAIYSILISPIAKYALIITPVSTAIENLLPNQLNNRAGRMASRCLLLATSMSMAFLFPYFGLLMALVGAILNVTLSLIVPSLCYLKIFGPQINWGFEFFLLLGIIIMGVSIAVIGTYTSIRQAFQH